MAKSSRVTRTSVADVRVGMTISDAKETTRFDSGKSIAIVVEQIEPCPTQPGYLHLHPGKGWSWCIHRDTMVRAV